MRRRTAVLLAFAVTAALSAPQAAGRAPAAPPDEQAAIHVLNRIGFGPRPGDIEKVQQMGLQEYIDLQLHPERIPDKDRAKLTAVKRFYTHRQSSRSIWQAAVTRGTQRSREDQG
jgi:hypothetical protein